MEVTNITSYRNRKKPQAFRVGSEAQQRRHLHVVPDSTPIDFKKWRRRIKQEVARQNNRTS